MKRPVLICNSVAIFDTAVADFKIAIAINYIIEKN
jgi:hypothetical protein